MLSSCGKEIAKKAVVLPHSFDAELYDASIAPRSSDKIQMVYIGHLDATRTPRLFLKGIAALKKEHPTLQSIWKYCSMDIWQQMTKSI